MPVTEFDLVLEEFSAELDAIEAVLSSLPSGSGSSTPLRARVAGANAALLLMAATFEEFVRQLVKTTFVARTQQVSRLADLGSRITAIVWKRSLTKVARLSTEDLKRRAQELKGQMASTVAFCLDGELTADVGASVAHNENNMRPQQLNELFNSVGMKDAVGSVANREEVQESLLAENRGAAVESLHERFEDFFRRRNQVAHAIIFGSSSAREVLLADIGLLRTFGRALTEECKLFAAAPMQPEIPVVEA